MLYCNESDCLLFLASPLIDGLEALTSRGLYISDIPIHDATRDIVLVGEQARAQVCLFLFLFRPSFVLLQFINSIVVGPTKNQSISDTKSRGGTQIRLLSCSRLNHVVRIYYLSRWSPDWLNGRSVRGCCASMSSIVDPICCFSPFSIPIVPFKSGLLSLSVRLRTQQFVRYHHVREESED